MGISFEMLLVTSSVGALQSFFFGIYLFTVQRRKNIANLFLALLLVAFAVRILKSVGYYFSEGHVIPDMLMNLGFGCNLAIWPLLWLYLNAFVGRDYRFAWKRDAVHLLPAVVILMLSPVLTDRFWLGQYGYFISLISMLAYLPFCIHLVVKNWPVLIRVQRLWIISLLVGIAVVWFTYLFNFVFGLVPYISGPVLFSLLVYFLSFVGLRQGSLFTRESRYQGSAHSATQLDTCFLQLQQIFVQSQSFKDPSLTLPRLAGQLGVSANLLSEAINTKAGLNFTDFVNRHRIQEAQRLLQRPDHAHQKIAAIAYEAGFNSLSVFNTAFKKFTSQTPSAYRKRLPQR
jgi:AraC-like DNA-binding protein